MASSKRKNRVIALGLADALNVAEQIHRQGGGDKVPKESLVPMVKSKPTSSLFERKVSALRSYGLISVQGEEILLTQLGKAYAIPITPEDRTNIALKVFLKIPIFSNLLNRYNNSPLPEINEFFYNLVAASYDVPQEDAPKWVNEFINGAKLAGVLVSEGGHEYIRLPGQVSAPFSKIPMLVTPVSSTSALGEIDKKPQEELPEQEEIVHLRISGGKVIMNIPDEIGPEILKKSIDAAKDALLMMKSRYDRLMGKQDNDGEK
jgi:hypothetical protein